MTKPAATAALHIPLWVSCDQWDQAQASVDAARASARLQAAQMAMLAVEVFFQDCPDAESLDLAWKLDGDGRAVLSATARGHDGAVLERSTHGATLAYARGQANALAAVWERVPLWRMPKAVHRDAPWAQIGPALLGEEFFGAWVADRERLDLAKGVPSASQSRGAARGL